MLHSGTIETRKVFLDTSVLVSTQFGDSASFRSLITMANMGGASFVSTDITLREVQAHIAEAVRVAVRSLQSATNKVAVLRRSTPTLEPVFQKYDEEALKTAVWKMLDHDLRLGELEIIPVSGVNPERVFNRYFHGDPPFGAGKKKSEFPDAFVLYALEDWCTAKSCKVYVVSGDDDWKQACSNSPSLIHISLTDLVERLWKEEDAANLASYYTANITKIKDAIYKAFLNSGTILNDQDGHVNSLSVGSLDIEIESVSDTPNGEQVIVCTGSVDFTAEVKYADPDAGNYDRESGHTFVWNYKEESLDRTEDLEVEVRVKQTDDDYEVLSVVINNGLPITVDVDDRPLKYRYRAC